MDQENVRYTIAYDSAIKRNENLAICDNKEGPRVYYARGNTSDREKQMPHDFTYMWNLKTKQNS